MQVVAQVRRADRICTVQIGAAALAIFLLPLVAPARAQPMPPESQRTVQWYATHPRERGIIRQACLNDPGHLQHSPDCINAARGDLEAAANDAGRRTAPSRTLNRALVEHFSTYPGDRTLQLGYCRRMPPEAAAKADCNEAEESLRLDQQRGLGNGQSEALGTARRRP